MKLSTETLFHQFHISGKPSPLILSTICHFSNFRTQLRSTNNLPEKLKERLARALVLMPHYWTSRRESPRKSLSLLTITAAAAGVPPPPLDLTEDNVRLVLADARNELGQIFDTSIGITGQAELAELDGPFVKISLKGRFWHKRSTVLARIANYLKQRIPEILEVEIEDEKQLDDSPANF